LRFGGFFAPFAGLAFGDGESSSSEEDSTFFPLAFPLPLTSAFCSTFYALAFAFFGSADTSLSDAFGSADLVDLFITY
jgi:hypothetical protein